MMDNVPEKDLSTASVAAPSSSHDSTSVAASEPVSNEAAEAGDTPAVAGAERAPGRGGSRRGGRNRRGGAAAQGNGAGESAGGAAPARAPRAIPPALETLAGLYPHLFGAVFRPLKRGIFQDLLAAHPDAFEKEELKVALGVHTRSTRYLQSVAAGDKRHNLQGEVVEDMAPEHVHQALLEVYRRRKGRGTDDLLPKLRNRMIVAFEASGLSREDYTALVAGRDEAANTILEEAFAQWAERNAKDEALLRAFEASGSTPEQFADMYGMDQRAVGQMLARGRKLREPVVAPAEPAVE